MHYRVYANIWPYGTHRQTFITRDFTAESEDEVRDLFDNEYPSMWGSYTILRIEVVEND